MKNRGLSQEAFSKLLRINEYGGLRLTVPSIFPGSARECGTIDSPTRGLDAWNARTVDASTPRQLNAVTVNRAAAEAKKKITQAVNLATIEGNQVIGLNADRDLIAFDRC